MFIRRKFDKILVAVIAVGLFLAASIHTGFRVSPAMPRDFVDRANLLPGHDGTAEEKIAGAYWNSVVARIQWMYSYQQYLPQNPPPEFTSLSPGLEGAGDAATRIRYWRKLNQVWYRPDTWTKEYEWDFHWVSNPVVTAANWWQDQVRKFSL
jgi:hypothetical protein